MILKNVKAVKINGMRLSVEYTDDVNKLEGDNFGLINHAAGTIHIKKSMDEWMRSKTLWHEIAHSISYIYKIQESKENSDYEFNEREASRLAAALNSLEIEYYDLNHGEIKEPTWQELGRSKPRDGQTCILKNHKTGREKYICAKWHNGGDKFDADGGNYLFDPQIMWVSFDQRLWEKLNE